MTPNDIIWKPEDHAWTESCHVAAFMRKHGMDCVADLLKKSTEDIEWFWDEAIKDMGLSWSQPYDKVLDMSEGFPWAKWFQGGRINITYNCIDRHVMDGHGEETALIYEADSGRSEDAQIVSFAELKRLVDRCVGSMRQMGVGAGDFVGLYAPMSVETVAVMFASFKVGASFVPIFCGFGEHAVVDRLESCGAKLLFANKALQRRGKDVPTGDTVMAAKEKVPSLERLVFLDTDQWDDFLGEGDGVADACEDTESEHPCMLIYTSGTTGKPKGTVHTHAGVLAQVGKELRYAFDVHAGEPFFWVTDIGWMMGPWELIGCLLYRAPVVMLDGAPDYPHTDRLWEIIERRKVVTLGISPTAVRLFMGKTDAKGPEGFDFSKLRLMGSTGEPWDETSYRWAFEKIGGGRCPIMNISGGTEIMGCHLQPYPVMPLKPMTLGMGALAMDVKVFNNEGESVREEVGHLVCCQPAPSMTKSFLGDDARYLDTYFKKFGEDVWYHGDWASIDEDGFWFLHGRTDDTIKVAGKRIGPAEVESALIAHPDVNQAAVIGAPDNLKGQALVCFVVAVAGASPTEAELKNFVADRMGKPLKPREIYVVSDLPKTRSGKIMRSTIQRVYLGEDAGDLGSVENLDSLNHIATLRSLEHS